MGWRGRSISLLSVVLFLSVIWVLVRRAFPSYAGADAGTVEIVLVALIHALLLAAAYRLGRQYDQAAHYLKMNADSAALVEDLRRRKRELQESEERYKEILEQIPDAVFVYCSGRVVYANSAGYLLHGKEKLFQLDFTRLIGLVHPEDYDAVTKLARKPGPKPPVELRLLNKEGVYIESEVRVSRTLFQGERAYQIIIRDLTDVKSSGRKLLDVRKEQEEVLRNQPGITFKYKPSGEDYVHTMWEGELSHLVGLFSEQVVGRTLRQLFDPEQAGVMASCYRSCWVEARPVEFETQLSGVPCLVDLKPIIRNGAVLEVVGYCTDLTLRKQTEEELVRAKEMLESFFNNTSDAINVVDLEGYIIHINVAFEELFGWTYRESIGRRLNLIIPPDLHEEAENLTEVVRFGGHVSGYETKRVRKNGELLDVSITVSPIRNDQGETIAVAAISRDITGAKQVESALRQSEAKYRLITENMSEIICVLDQEGLILYMSPSSRTMMGVEPELMTECNVRDWIHPSDMEKVDHLYGRLTSTAHNEIAEIRVRHADGDWVGMEASSRWIPHFGEGNRPCILVVARDITERKRTEEMLRKSEKLSVVGQLAAGVAHEIRNPLTSLKGFLQLLKERTAENTFFFEVMLSELERINTIVSEFLVLSKPQNTKFKREPIDRIVAEVVAFLESQALLNNVVILTDLSMVHPIEVVCDENQLKQVFINLLKNAVEAMPKGGRVHVTLLEPAPGRVVVRFRDEGPGIPQERLEKLGEPFYTTKEKGTGLGLMVSFRIIEDHGGIIRAKSELGIGTVFDVELPVSVMEVSPT